MNVQEMMKQAQAMQVKMEEMQAKLGEIEVDGQSGGGMVKVTMTCRGHVAQMKIDPSVVDPSDVEMLEDLVKAAMNDARANADQTLADETQKMMSGMGLPADFQMPF